MTRAAGGGRRNGYEKVNATVASAGGFFALKGCHTQDPTPRRMTVWRREERSSVMPYGAPDRRTMFTPDRIAIEKLDGTLVAEGRAPRDSFSSRSSADGAAQDEFGITPSCLRHDSSLLLIRAVRLQLDGGGVRA